MTLIPSTQHKFVCDNWERIQCLHEWRCTANNSDSDETSNLTVESMAREVAASIATCRMRWCPSERAAEGASSMPTEL